VYCEKPIGLDAGECVAVLAAAKRAEDRGQIYQSGFQRRYNPRYRASLEHLSSGEPGSVRFIRAQWHAVGSSRKDKPWLGRRGQSGDIVVEQACHQFDVFHWVFDAMPERAVGLGGAFGHDGVPGRDVLDHYGAVLEFPGGAKVQLSHLQFSVPDRRFAGIYELAFCENGAVDLANALAWDRSGKTRHLAYESGNETQIALASFIDCVRTRRRPLADAAVAYRATLSALLCRRALELSRPVSIDEIVPRGAA
ncbi:MAG TPA: Gfo/Idh/MocA family oxidoreductase, partial [Planctomycetota bacterium]|nr:Gfo/Idh/MocA family oxidoreductase [Planctomycetota bacterium]